MFWRAKYCGGEGWRRAQRKSLLLASERGIRGVNKAPLGVGVGLGLLAVLGLLKNEGDNLVGKNERGDRRKRGISNTYAYHNRRDGIGGRIAWCDAGVCTTGRGNADDINASINNPTGSLEDSFPLLKGFSKHSIEDDYVIGEILGEGGYGKVHAATSRKSGKRCAVKAINKKQIKHDEFSQEVDALRTIHLLGGHPNIAAVESMYENDKNFFLVEEFVAGGEMFQHLVNNGAYSEATAAELLRSLARGLNFLHSNGIVHADVKPENVLLSSWDDANADVKLVDFGCSGKVGHVSGRPIGGTACYWPPEVITYCQLNSSKGLELATETDMWAAGVVLFIMLTGAHPFDLNGDATEEEILQRIITDEIPVQSEHCQHLSSSAKDLIMRLCDKNPKKRCSSADMVTHPWITGETASEDVIEKSDQKLRRFQEAVKEKLQGCLFSILVNHAQLVYMGTTTEDSDVSQAVDVLKKAFSVFDKGSKGYLNQTDIIHAYEEAGHMSSALSEEESEHLAKVLAAQESEMAGNVVDFDNLIEQIDSVSYGKDDMIYEEGEMAEYLYFINSGKVKAIIDGVPVTTLGPGEMFGEAALLKNSPRSTTMQCINRVKLTRISKSRVEKLMQLVPGAKSHLEDISYIRGMHRVKAVFEAIKGVKKITLLPGTAAIRQGDVGNSMYVINNGTFDVSSVNDGKSQYIASLTAGDVFGEMGLMLEQPRNATVTCQGDKNEGNASGGPCVVTEMSGEVFFNLLGNNPCVSSLLRNLLQLRELHHRMAIVGGGKERVHMERAFDLADKNHSDVIDMEGLTWLLRRSGSKLSDADIRELMAQAGHTKLGYMCKAEFIHLMDLEQRHGGVKVKNRGKS